MKIAILFQGDLEKVSIGGVAEYVRNVIRFRGDNEVVLFGACHAGDFQIGVSVRREVCGVDYDFVPLCDDSKRPLSLWYTRSLRKERRKLDGFDIIYAQRPEYCLALKANEVEGRLFQIIHGSSAYTVRPLNAFAAKLYLCIERSSIRKCVRTLIIMKRDDVGLGYYYKLYPDLKDRFLYGRIPVDTGVFHPCDREKVRETLSIETGRFVVVFAGRVEDYPKRVLLFPRIVERIRETNPLLVVVGDGASMNELKAEISVRGVEDCFMLAGYCSDRGELANYIGMADLTLNISAFEGACTSSLESVACGTPVLSTDVGEIRTIVFNGKNGIVIPDGDDARIVEDAAKAIRRTCDLPLPMTDDFLAYSCECVFPELFGIFEGLYGGIESDA